MIVKRVEGKEKGKRRSGSKSKKKKRHKGEGKYPVRKGYSKHVIGKNEREQIAKYILLAMGYTPLQMSAVNL